MGSVGKNTSTYQGAPADFSMYPNARLRNAYGSVNELREAGFVATNDFSLDQLINPRNEVGVDAQPWNNKNIYYIWDPDWKRWMKAAEWRY